MEPGIVTVIVEPGSPVPLIVGVVSFVVESFSAPELELSARPSVKGLGAVESIVTAVVVDTVLPAASDCTTLTVCGPPSAKALTGVTLQEPFAVTVVVRTSRVPGIVTVMVAPGSPVPVMVGVVSEVMPSPTSAESELAAKLAVIVDGAVVSIVTGTVEAGLTLPAGSVAVTEKF